ncbi:hypothetical protein GOHSU_41_00450 [Gordonia hirsuta DSM 44140 = NBRC 16056]|uniref:Uncharacterized protein n=1 Tax=Gordonia hirsuta DSM 44140 = NBRC 16056 TaxID=1121927 RepID=L7LCR2_9ACTN|nr:hypothetical protein [Gordonia hirsuta]GAC58506.1 hypothetical protein GOHSU_41_00450 [Gordonia hirsuta DSM 44140 = NBRC 16056]
MIAIGLPAGAFLAVTVVGFVNRWGSSAWGAYGTWFTGVATFAAVIVALVQTRVARREADEARQAAAAERDRAEAQFRQELKAADERLARELDSARRIEQIKTIPPIWDVIGELNLLYPGLVAALKEAPGLPRTQESAAELMRVFGPWMNCSHRVEMAFSQAMMMVSEPLVLEAISELYEDTRTLHSLMISAANEAVAAQIDPDLTEFDKLMASIRSRRKSITALVREHLAVVGPLDYEKFGKSDPLAPKER